MSIGAIAHHEVTVQSTGWWRQWDHGRAHSPERISNCIALAFIAAEEEKAILEDRSAQACAELL